MKAMPRPPARKRSQIAVIIEDKRWREVNVSVLRRAARYALLHARREGELTILLSEDEALHVLNLRFRRIDRATNVLSFPAAEGTPGHLGDVALAYGVAEREARAHGKALTNHAAHLVAHGVLHLLGYDHQRLDEARTMEAAEVAILKRLGISDPYAHTHAAE